MVKRMIGAACGALVVGLCLAASAGAIGTDNRTTYLTFSADVALPGVTLAKGTTYIFELAAPMSNPSIVRVLTKDRSQVLLMAFTNFALRPAGTKDDKHVVIGEARRGETPPVKVWYPNDESMGREFIYR